MKKIRFLDSLLILFSIIIYINAQDSIYLNYTITGSTEHPLAFAKGVGDVNGDGYADLMVGFLGSWETYEYANLYLGGSTFDTIPDYTFPSSFFIELGDINNDHYDDILAMDTLSGKYQIKLYLGGSTIDSMPDFYFEAHYMDEVFTNKVEPIGDLNNDGFNDIAIGAPYNWSNGLGHVYIFWGGDTVKQEPDLIITSKLSGDQFGNSVCGINDVNYDGIDDLAIGATNEIMLSDSSSAVYIYYGSKNMDANFDTLLKGSFPDEIFGQYIQKAGDVNGDAIQDFIITSGGYTYIYSNLELQYKIFSLNDKTGAGGDINSDSFDDFLIGLQNYINDEKVMVGRCNIYYGSTNLDTLYDFSCEGENKWGEFGRRSDIVGDLNNDGFDEFIVISPKYPQYDNYEGKLYIYSTKNYSDLFNNKQNKFQKGQFNMYQNYPNPFNPSTTIQYDLPEDVKVVLEVYDIQGQKVKTLVNGFKEAGYYEVIFDGSHLASGLYIYKIKAADFSSSKRMLLIK
jgi:hypothetical protein